MRLFRPVEQYIRAKRRFLLDWMMRGHWIRRRHQRFFGPETLNLTMQCGDEIFTFQPRELIGRTLYVEGQWQRQSVIDAAEVLRSNGLLGSRRCVVELGANIGTQSVYLLKTGLFDRLLAVEAHPDNHLLLQRNLVQNGFADRATALRVAVAAENGTLELFTTEANQGGHSAALKPKGASSIVVPARTISSIVDSAGMAVQDVGFFWIDLEGMEFEIVRSIVETFGNGVPILLEFSPRFYGPDKTAEFTAFLKQTFKYFVAVPFAGAQSGPKSMALFAPDDRQCDILVFNAA
jgi:FkbM family methyltransferase